MTIVLPTLAVAFAAFCVWLTVRIVNRRERWAKWTIATAMGVPVLYVVSFGPACCWLATPLKNLEGIAFPTSEAPAVYWPVGWLASKGGPNVRRAVKAFAVLGLEGGVSVPTNADSTGWVIFYRD
jgi:hypothetical protein